MRWLAIIVLALLAAPVLANTVGVSSGEHPGFSRLVLTLPQDGAWRLGRTGSGYELDLGLEAPRYDVSTVFDLIPRHRLTGIFADPVTGNLQLTLGCSCHAMPFSLNGRTIVIDLRDGPAPATSSFETSLRGAPQAPLQIKDERRPRARPRPTGMADTTGYDWSTRPVAVTPPVFNAPLSDDTLGDIRQALVEQLANGAARGVVDLVMPAPAAPDGVAPQLPAQGPVRLTATPGLHAAAERTLAQTMQPDGADCVADDRLDITSWGLPDGVPHQIATARQNLVREFDNPQADAVATTVRLYLYLGFGVEAATLMAAMPTGHVDEPLWKSMAVLIDGHDGTTSVFDGMTSCDTNAALWALIAAPDGGRANPNLAAVQRAFSALPPHLRQHLGPRIADRLLALDAAAAAQAITATMGRSMIASGPATLLAGARVDLETGAAADAVAKAETALLAGGTTAAQALVILVDAQTAAGTAVDPAAAGAIAAMQAEYAGQPLAVDLARAHQLALAGSGQFGAVFATSDAPVPAAVWPLIAARGSDDDLLRFAMLPPAAVVPPTTAAEIATRLQRLGFSTAAKAWMQMTDDAVWQPLTASPKAAHDKRWQQDWSAVASADDGAWSVLAAQVSVGLARITDEAPLAEATRLVKASTTTRDLIEQLLQTTAQPGG